MKHGQFLANLYDNHIYLHLYTHTSALLCHPPGCFSELATSMILRIYILRVLPLPTHQRAAQRVIWSPPRQILPSCRHKTFISRICPKTTYLQMKNTCFKSNLSQKVNNKLFLHLKCTPGDPDSKNIQKLWRDVVLHTSTKKE